MVKIFSNDTKDVSENKTLNNDFKKLEIPNSTCNFSKYDKCKDLMIVKPTSIDSEDIIINKRTEIASGNLSDSNLYFNNGSDRLIIITPTIIKGENILNKDQNTSIGIKQILDSNLKNCTNGDGNELNNPEISSSAMDYSSILYDDIDDNTDDEIQDKDNRKCYGELGCLSITPTWYHTLNRNLNKLPLPREVINTSIIIYTREDPTKGQVIVVSKIKSVELINFNPKRKTKFIIHGFNSSPHVPWAKDMKNELLQHDDFNVIVVDWTGGSSIILFYTQTAGNTRLVGLEIAYLIKYLHIKYGLKLNDVHLIGHSLGAHIAGYAGEKLHGKIGRISGLDSAMPDFEKMPIHVRLDPTDAKLVDVIHTDSSRIVRLGIYQPCGHLDFYPNDGDDQPGCSESFFGEVCDHTRAIKLFTESINSKCQFIAHECPRYEDFIEGQCFLCNNTNSVNCGIMGYHADKSPTLLQKLIPEESAIRPPKFFISTGDKYPYCRRHYRITIKLAKPFIAKTFMQGLMNVTFYGDNGIIKNMEITPYGRRIKLIHGSTKQIIALPPENTEYSIGKIRKVELSWIYDSKYTDFLYICIFCNDVLYVESIIVDILELIPERKKREMELSSELCSIQGPKKYAAISSGSSAPFVDNCD
ncbi:GSCOCG00006812001-RA-CDS [Cotesia congregata]|nr:GSCOCG00006812001-RA-CDS [Cotesia congregata]